MYGIICYICFEKEIAVKAVGYHQVSNKREVEPLALRLASPTGEARAEAGAMQRQPATKERLAADC